LPGKVRAPTTSPCWWVAACPAPQFCPFLDESLLERDSCRLGCLDDLAPGNFQKAAVHRVGHRFLLHRGIDDHPLEFCRTHRLDLHCAIDGRLQEFLNRN
jgi:hypothetical protein